MYISVLIIPMIKKKYIPSNLCKIGSKNRKTPKKKLEFLT